HAAGAVPDVHRCVLPCLLRVRVRGDRGADGGAPGPSARELHRPWNPRPANLPLGGAARIRFNQPGSGRTFPRVTRPVRYAEARTATGHVRPTVCSAFVQAFSHRRGGSFFRKAHIESNRGRRTLARSTFTG